MATRLSTGDHEGLPWQAQVENAREVVADLCPGELELFDYAAAEYHVDPRRVLGRTRLRAPVGAGVDIASLTPYVLLVMQFLCAAAAARVVDRATDALLDKISHATRVKLAALLRRPSPGLGSGEDDVRSTPMRWDAADEKEIEALLASLSIAIDLSPDEAHRLSKALLVWLRLRAGKDTQA
ncbi:hypothetical protein ABGB17_27085 [Sphaerisporangium sp. B11E5]|uniref:hypothetical protein n=1 Tax=Sphaerisporangium sp. B11E5 TaxID=3153563 RepID=UPI00325E9314